MYTLNCNGKLIDLSRPKVMGIINVTPDSFYDGGKITSEKQALIQAEQMLAEGATFLDIGGYSSRPGASEVSEEEELERVIPIIRAICGQFLDVIISVDTFRSTVAKAAVEAGAAVVNDISGGTLDEYMISTVGDLQVPYIMMHMKGNPKTMSSLTNYKQVTQDVLYYFSERIALARKAGINDIIADPGFGFAKTQEQNFELLNELELFRNLNIPILAGISRKSMIYKTLNIDAQDALNGTSALHSIALLKGASILRVHDVKEANECITLVENLNGAS